MQLYICLALLISFFWGAQPVIYKHLLQKYNSITVMLCSSIVYVTLIAGVSLIRKKELVEDVRKITSNDAAYLVGIPVFTIFLANMIYFYILKDHESSIISALIYTCPVFTVFLSYLFLKERLTMYKVVGIVFVIFGVILVG
jgi:uncharacterized membrane protein